MGDDQPARGKDLGKERLFIFRSAAHAEARGLIVGLRRVELRLRAGFCYAVFYRAGQLRAAFGGANVVARAALADA